MKKLILVLSLFLAFGLMNIFSAEFGVILNGQFDAERLPGETSTDEATIKGSLTLAPWFSLPLGGADFHVSLGLKGEFADKSNAIPELYRFEYSDRPIESLALRFGRFGWQDTSGFTAKGRFDGVDIIYSQGKARIGAAVLYTGFLYRDTADINVSPKDDPKKYTAAFKWTDFADTYAAPPRLLASLYGEFPGLPPDRGHLYAGLLAQFDLSDASEAFHTQYLLLRHTLAYKRLDLNIAGALELENTDAKGVAAAFAASLEAGLLLPGQMRNRLALAANWASGEGPKAAAYFPIIKEAQGLAFKPYFSGMMTLGALYEVRLHSSLSLDAGMRYFIRTDSSTYTDPDLTPDSYAIGAEFHGGLLWVPLSDLSCFLTGGVFLPKTGGAMVSSAPARWALSLGTTLSF